MAGAPATSAELQQQFLALESSLQRMFAAQRAVQQAPSMTEICAQILSGGALATSAGANETDTSAMSAAGASAQHKSRDSNTVPPPRNTADESDGSRLANARGYFSGFPSPSKDESKPAEDRSTASADNSAHGGIGRIESDGSAPPGESQAAHTVSHSNENGPTQLPPEASQIVASLAPLLASSLPQSQASGSAAQQAASTVPGHPSSSDLSTALLQLLANTPSAHAADTWPKQQDDTPAALAGVLATLQTLLNGCRTNNSSTSEDATPVASPTDGHLLPSQGCTAFSRAASHAPTSQCSGAALTSPATRRRLSKQVSFQDWRGLARQGARSRDGASADPACSALLPMTPRRREPLPAEHPKVSPRLFDAPREQPQQQQRESTSGPQCLPGPATPIRGSRARRASTPCRAPQREGPGALSPAAWVPPGSRCSKFDAIGSNQAHIRSPTRTGAATLRSPRSPSADRSAGFVQLALRSGADATLAGGNTPDGLPEPQPESPARSRSSSPLVMGCNGRVWPVSGTSRPLTSIRSGPRLATTQPRRANASTQRTRSLRPVNSAQAAALARLRMDASYARQWGNGTHRAEWDTRRPALHATHSGRLPPRSSGDAGSKDEAHTALRSDCAWDQPARSPEVSRQLSALQAIARDDSEDAAWASADVDAASASADVSARPELHTAARATPASRSNCGARRALIKGWADAEDAADLQVAVMGGTGCVVGIDAAEPSASHASGIAEGSQHDALARERSSSTQSLFGQRSLACLQQVAVQPLHSGPQDTPAEGGHDSCDRATTAQQCSLRAGAAQASLRGAPCQADSAAAGQAQACARELLTSSGPPRPAAGGLFGGEAAGGLFGGEAAGNNEQGVSPRISHSSSCGSAHEDISSLQARGEPPRFVAGNAERCNKTPTPYIADGCPELSPSPSQLQAIPLDLVTTAESLSHLQAIDADEDSGSAAAAGLESPTLRHTVTVSDPGSHAGAYNADADRDTPWVLANEPEQRLPQATECAASSWSQGGANAQLSDDEQDTEPLRDIPLVNSPDMSQRPATRHGPPSPEGAPLVAPQRVGNDGPPEVLSLDEAREWRPEEPCGHDDAASAGAARPGAASDRAADEWEAHTCVDLEGDAAAHGSSAAASPVGTWQSGRTLAADEHARLSTHLDRAASLIDEVAMAAASLQELAGAVGANEAPEATPLREPATQTQHTREPRRSAFSVPALGAESAVAGGEPLAVGAMRGHGGGAATQHTAGSAMAPLTPCSPTLREARAGEVLARTATEPGLLQRQRLDGTLRNAASLAASGAGGGGSPSWSVAHARRIAGVERRQGALGSMKERIERFESSLEGLRNVHLQAMQSSAIAAYTMRASIEPSPP